MRGLRVERDPSEVGPGKRRRRVGGLDGGVPSPFGDRLRQESSFGRGRQEVGMEGEC